MQEAKKIKFKPLYLEVCGMPFIYTGHHQWLVQVALSRKIAGYMTLSGQRYGTSSTIANQRRALIEKGLKTDATHFLFVDWDVIPPKDAIMKLFMHDKNIVSGVYYSKDEFDKPVCIKNGEKYEGSGLEEVDVLCMGFSLIKREVFEEIDYPKGNGDTDTEFCNNAISSGFNIYTDFDLVAEHLGVFSNRDEKLKLNKDLINLL